MVHPVNDHSATNDQRQSPPVPGASTPALGPGRGREPAGPSRSGGGQRSPLHLLVSIVPVSHALPFHCDSLTVTAVNKCLHLTFLPLGEFVY